MNAVPLAILSTDRLRKTYPDGSVDALVDVSLEVKPGQFVAITGESGSGKSTLLNLLGALDEPTSGSVKFQGLDLKSWPSLDRFRAEKIGFVFQSFHLLPTLTALENVQIPLFAGSKSATQRKAVAARLLDLVKLSHRANHLPSRLSVGERQRVSIARALSNDPEVLLADEPTGNLDSKTGAEIMNLFEQIRQDRKMTMIVVTHTTDVSDRAERTIRIHDGRVISDESVLF